MNLEIKTPTFGETNDYNNYDEFGEFESLDIAKEKDHKIIDINTNTGEELFDTMNNEFNDELEENTSETNSSLSSALELDELYIEAIQPNDNLRKKTVKKKKTNEVERKKPTKPTKVRKLNKNKDSSIENYKYAA